MDKTFKRGQSIVVDAKIKDYRERMLQFRTYYLHSTKEKDLPTIRMNYECIDALHIQMSTYILESWSAIMNSKDAQDNIALASFAFTETKENYIHKWYNKIKKNVLR